MAPADWVSRAPPATQARIRELLALLLDAGRCAEEDAEARDHGWEPTPCALKNCRDHKKLLGHMRGSCKAAAAGNAHGCKYRNCADARRALDHWRGCGGDDACRVCRPLLRSGFARGEAGGLLAPREPYALNWPLFKLVCHSTTCATVWPCRDHPLCDLAKMTLSHQEKCRRGRRCPGAFCSEVRRLLAHWRSCRHGCYDCSILKETCLGRATAVGVLRLPGSPPAPPPPNPTTEENNLRKLEVVLRARECVAAEAEEREEKGAAAAPRPCAHLHCRTVRRAVLHAEHCGEDHCRVPYCLMAKSAYAHWDRCRAKYCPVCGPILEARHLRRSMA